MRKEFDLFFRFIFLILFVLLFSPSLAGNRLPETIIRVGILENVYSANLSAAGGFEVIDLGTGRHAKLKKSSIYLVLAASEGIRIGDEIFGPALRFKSLSDNEMLRVNGRRYRDGIKISLNNKGNLNVINELGIEGYLYGVMTREVSPEWPIEALKAQAVVSRTYVMKNLGKYDKEGFDLSATITSQVYGGGEAEDPRTSKAVDLTRGQVITYEGELIKSFFHSNCGGRTEDVTNAWEGEQPFPYLKGVVCYFCKKTHQYYWEKTIKKKMLTEKLNENGYSVEEIKKIKILGRSSSGRVTYLKIYHGGGRLKIRGNAFRMLMGPNIIKSTLFAMEHMGNRIKFYGRGWGHGVGMCQWGAKGMAERGANYRQILRYYYPKTKIEKWED
ncbi:SpoIID/LytB domain-containing protein [bacterium]|nr:SpoIID/LytB domain-containing protein [bacterium]NIN92442.1 SpoIID/LytB domain-containing protein [bacterium]NIO18556.1 SpoIID/LytB domain-containing protein [bacterium]NIO73552.1 SpoIID/LytB domain-containing protein [bacterium]